MDRNDKQWLLIGFFKILLLTTLSFIPGYADDLPAIEAVTVVEGTTAVLSCDVDGLENLKVEWYTDNGRINTDDERFNEDNDGVLSISNTSQLDQLIYYCKEGSNGKIRKSLLLDVTEKKDENAANRVAIRVEAGENAILPCYATSGPNAKVVWMMLDKKAPLTVDGLVFIGDARFSIGPDNELHISNVTPLDSSIYTCRKTNEETAVLTEVMLEVIGVHDKVTIQVEEGKEAILPCNASPRPDVIVTWKRADEQYPMIINGIIIDSDARIRLGDNSELRISDVTPFDSSIYKCSTSIRGVTSVVRVISLEVIVNQNTSPEPSVDWSYKTVRLPQDVRPSLYNISFRPSIYDGPANFTYTCVTRIYLTCLKSTHFIRLHSLDHELSSITLFENQGELTDSPSHMTVKSKLDKLYQMLHIWVEDGLQAGHEYVLEIHSSAIILPSLRGFYYNEYRDEGVTKYIFITMMEPTDARRVFPCFDEPDFKAIFIFTVDRKEGMRSLTNLPLRTTAGPDDEGFYTDVFDQPRNVPMSTYLVAIAIGELDYLETYAGKTKFRTWCRSNAVHATEYALEIGAKIMDFFEDYFKIKYPLPKEDMIAVPLMSFSAMEHWGLITYAEDSMFYEEGITSEVTREWIAVIVAHELSHQWFGNLVSPRWWDDLWLNEGFATYMMFTALKHVQPDWKTDDKIVVDYRGIQNVFKVDSGKTSHPVYIPVEHPDEISQIFDLISYAKGGALIRMMNYFLGEETFTKGLTRYLTEFSYKTATHNDLWYSLGNQSLEDGNAISDVKNIMDTWLLEANYPLVTMTRKEDGSVRVVQTPFLITQAERDARPPVCWSIPLWYTTKDDANFERIAPSDITWLSNDCTEVILNSPKVLTSSWIIGNTKQLGYFRVNYDVTSWNAIFEQLKCDHLVIDPINRAQIISDSFNLARAGIIEFDLAMKSLDYIDKEMDFVPWKAALIELTFIRRCLHITPAYGAFKRFMRNKIESPFFATFETEPTHYNTIRYSLMAHEACRYGVKACTGEATREFREWMKSNARVKLDPNLKGTVYCVGVAEGGEEAVKFVMQAYTKAESSQEKTYLLDALSCTQIPWLLNFLLRSALFTEDFSITDRLYIVEQIALTPVGRLMAWGFLVEHWDQIFDVYGHGLNLFSSLIKTVTRPFNTQSELKSLERFMNETADLGTGQGAFEMALEQTRANIEITAKLEKLFAD